MQNKKNLFTTKEMTTISMLTCLLVASSQINVPFLFAVPFTLQTFFVFLIQNIGTPKTSIFTILLYILLGAIGAPVFSRFGSGVGVLFGPTGGYIWGFLVSTICMAWPSAKFVHSCLSPYRRIGFRVVFMLCAIVIIHGMGIFQFSIVNHISTSEAFYSLCAFIGIDVAKGVVAVFISEELRQRRVGMDMLL